MYRIFPAIKDNMITNKIIAGKRMEQSNIGQNGTVALFKLYDETPISGVQNPVELSRVLIQFDYSSLQELTSSILSIDNGNFSAFLSMKNVYGGQTVPSNYTLSLFPLSKSFDEGRGQDIVAFRDLDASNWLTASLSPPITWSLAGAGASGSLGDSNIDIITSATFGTSSVSLGVNQFFERGDEDLLIDITQLVSASLAGLLPNNGFRLSFSDIEEQDTTTYFVKRFGTRHTYNKNLQPKLIVKYTGDVISDPGSELYFDVSQSAFTYNILNGQPRNFYSGSTELAGNDIVNLHLNASKNIKVSTTEWSPSHSASITYLSNSISYISRSFSGSLFSLNSIPQTGIYTAPIILSLVEDEELSTFIDNKDEIDFDATWFSADNSIKFAKTKIKFKKLYSNFINANQQNIVVSMPNFKNEYKGNEISRIRVNAIDTTQNVSVYRLPTVLKSLILPDMRWQVRNAYTRDIIIPFDLATKMSSDSDGMYFDFYFMDLDKNQIYEFEFLIKDNVGKDTTITNQGFRFKVSA